VTVAIVGTNDIHGSALPTSLFRSDNNQTYNYGGLQFMASMIETIRREHRGNFLYLDAGDQFQGGIEASPLVSQGDIMNDYFNAAQVDSSAVGNHEFDFGPDFLFPYWLHRREDSSNLAANLQSETGEQEFLPKHKNARMFTLESGIKIGVIGLATVETPETTGAFNDGSFPKYQFLDYGPVVEEQSRWLRGQGADAVLILSHMGNYCEADNSYGLWFENTRQGSSCQEEDEMGVLLKSLPTGTIDGVVQGHRHRFSHHFIRGVPVMGTINGGYYFNILYLSFYNKQIYDRYIEGPVPVCEKVFQNLGTCDYQTREQLKAAGELTDWEFHGRKVVADEQVQQLFKTKWLPKMKEYLEPLVLNELYLERDFEGESRLGNLATDLMDMAFPGHDLVLTNEGGFRTIWTPGVLQYQHFYNMFPFPNQVVAFDITGAELLKTLEVLQTGKKAYYPTKHLRQHVTLLSDGSRRLGEVTFADGRPIELEKTYRGLSLDFLIAGGDDFAHVRKFYTPRNEEKLGDFRESLKPQLVTFGTLTESKLIDPLHPRLIIDRL
jgi:5'-nucleotidase